MRHFNFLDEKNIEHLFFQKPADITPDSAKSILSSALGATLYCPSIRPNLAEDILKRASNGAMSIVICLEDSIPDDKVEEGELNLVKTLKELSKPEHKNKLPLLFVRIRTAAHLKKVAEMNKEYLSVLTGFAFPKFEDITGAATNFVNELQHINEERKASNLRSLYFMPILESPIMVYRESREAVLHGVKDILAEHRENVLAVRIGATDMSSVYGIRRPRGSTVYDVHVIASVIADIVNLLGRANNGYVITGAVWEHFDNGERIFKPQLRESLFDGDYKLRRELLTKGYDSLIREIELDRANGLLGKTVIHPTHINLVHAMSVVTHEEFSDASDIAKGDNSLGGATSSVYKNKMNEIKPHLAWAHKTLLRAEAFGVANPDIDFVDFLEASMN